MGLSHQELEDLADNLLLEVFKDKKKNKSRTDAYPILSPSQMKRRFLSEISYSNLSIRQKMNARMKDMEYECEEEI